MRLRIIAIFTVWWKILQISRTSQNPNTGLPLKSLKMGVLVRLKMITVEEKITMVSNNIFETQIISKKSLKRFHGNAEDL